MAELRDRLRKFHRRRIVVQATMGPHGAGNEIIAPVCFQDVRFVQDGAFISDHLWVEMSWPQIGDWYLMGRRVTFAATVERYWRGHREDAYGLTNPSNFRLAKTSSLDDTDTEGSARIMAKNGNGHRPTETAAIFNLEHPADITAEPFGSLSDGELDTSIKASTEGDVFKMCGQGTNCIAEGGPYLPLSAFYPSQREHKGVKCKACAKKADGERKQRLREEAKKLESPLEITPNVPNVESTPESPSLPLSITGERLATWLVEHIRADVAREHEANTRAYIDEQQTLHNEQFAAERLVWQTERESLQRERNLFEHGYNLAKTVLRKLKDARRAGSLIVKDDRTDAELNAAFERFDLLPKVNLDE